MNHFLKGTVDWERLHLFHAVAESGSFTRAGRKLRLSQSAVSRQVSALEGSLKVALFYRHARGLILTEQGEELYRAVQEMAERLSHAVQRINEVQGEPEGPLKITTTVTFGSAWLTSRINRFHLQYPDIAVSLVLTDGPELDIFAREADVAIRFIPQTNPRAIQSLLFSAGYHLFASPLYLASHSAPKLAQDLDRHELIVYGEEAPAPIENMNWVLEAGRPKGEPRKPALRVNSVYGIYRAVKSGLGIGALPQYVVEDSPELVPILPELSGPTFNVYLVYPEERRWCKRVSVLREFLLHMVEEDRRAGAPARAPAPQAA